MQGLICFWKLAPGVPSVQCLAWLLACLLMSGCASVTQNQSAKLSLGMPVAEVDRTLLWVVVDARYNFTSHGRDYSVRQYRLQTGLKDNWMIYGGRPCPPGVDTTCSVYAPLPVTEPYFVVMDDETQTLAAYGTMRELINDPDIRVQDIVMDLAATYARRQLSLNPQHEMTPP